MTAHQTTDEGQARQEQVRLVLVLVRQEEREVLRLA